MKKENELENFHELNYDLDNLRLNKVENLEYYNLETEVYDLEIENMHNYETLVGLAHNGGGRP
jgi:hypothetical protein